MALPPGFRFHPTDEELVAYYLRRKVAGRSIEFNIITEIDLYKQEPWDLPDKSFFSGGDWEWYFFSPRDKKYPNGLRTNRATEAGYWKATGKDRVVKKAGKSVGMKKTLVFYRGRAPHGERTDWVMHEYRLDEEECEKVHASQDLFVLCRVFKKSGVGPRSGEDRGPQTYRDEEVATDTPIKGASSSIADALKNALESGLDSPKTPVESPLAPVLEAPIEEAPEPASALVAAPAPPTAPSPEPIAENSGKLSVDDYLEESLGMSLFPEADQTDAERQWWISLGGEPLAPPLLDGEISKLPDRDLGDWQPESEFLQLPHQEYDSGTFPSSQLDTFFHNVDDTLPDLVEERESGNSGDDFSVEGVLDCLSGRSRSVSRLRSRGTEDHQRYGGNVDYASAEAQCQDGAWGTSEQEQQLPSSHLDSGFLPRETNGLYSDHSALYTSEATTAEDDWFDSLDFVDGDELIHSSDFDNNNSLPSSSSASSSASSVTARVGAQRPHLGEASGRNYTSSEGAPTFSPSPPGNESEESRPLRKPLAGLMKLLGSIPALPASAAECPPDTKPVTLHPSEAGEAASTYSSILVSAVTVTCTSSTDGARQQVQAAVTDCRLQGDAAQGVYQQVVSGSWQAIPAEKGASKEGDALKPLCAKCDTTVASGGPLQRRVIRGSSSGFVFVFVLGAVSALCWFLLLRGMWRLASHVFTSVF